jgi:hypothetical protein
METERKMKMSHREDWEELESLINQAKWVSAKALALKLEDSQRLYAVVCYTYRTAFVADRTMEMPRDAAKRIELLLCAHTGQRIDNHVTFTWANWKGDRRVVSFTDSAAIFGNRISVGSW